MSTSALETNLIFWPEESAWSLVQKSAVDAGAKLGSKTLVKFKGKKYPAILIAKGTTSSLKSEGKRFQEYLNALLFEEETTDDVIRRIREEYLNTTKTVNVLANSQQEDKVANADDLNPLDKAANDTPLAKSLNDGNLVPATKKLNDRADSRDAHNTTPVNKEVSAGSTTKTIVSSTPVDIGAGSTTASASETSITTSDSDMDSNSANVILLEEEDIEVYSPSIKKFKSRKIIAFNNYFSRKDYVTKEELDAVVDDLRSLRRRVRKLEAAAANTTKEQKSEADIDLKQLIENADNEFNAVEILLLHFFDKETILQSSVSGKRANTKVNLESVKKALDFTKIAKIKSVLKSKFPAVKQKDITQKIHSVQKKLQRRCSKE